MRAHAIVIGIDSYSHPEWRLSGAVRDAIAFAQWAVGAGGVEIQDLTLLLSPLSGDPVLGRLTPANGPDLSTQVKPATRSNITQTFHSYQSGGKDADRLWFYYGGHGLAPSGQATTAGPLIVPADVEDIDYYVNFEQVGLETFRGSMEDLSPKEQFYFIDACRDVLPTASNKVLSQQLLWDVRDVDDQQLATQAIFLATTAGQRSKELRGQGLFGRALLAALRGLGPDLSPPAAPPPAGVAPRRRLLFDNLVKFVREAVQNEMKGIPGVQVPYSRVNRQTGPITVAEFAPGELPLATLTAIIDPEIARRSGRIEFLQWNDDESRFVPRPANPAPVGPPVPEQATFEVRGGEHFIRITAGGFTAEETKVLIYEDKRIPIELKAAPEDILESLGPDETTGTIVANARDPLALVSLFDGGRKLRDSQYGAIRVEGLNPGPYRVVAELTSAHRVEQIVQVQPGEESTAILQIEGPRVNPALAAELVASDIRVDENYLYPSKNFGAVANARLGSILAYAAWAARWPESEGFDELRSLGVDPINGLDPNGCAVQVLIGDLDWKDAGATVEARVQLEPVSASGASAVAASRRSIVLGSGALDDRANEVTPLGLSPIKGLSQGRQTFAVLPTGPVRVRVEMPGFAPASFAVALIPGFVSVLVVARQEDDHVDVQQYLNPIDPMRPIGEGFQPPKKDDIRLVELAWRALQGRDPLDAIEHGGLIEGKRSNPLLGVIAGYRMLRTERANEFRVLPQQPSTPGKTKSALWNLVQFFPDLPDVHVLAGLYDPERRAEHFERAMHAGTPVLVEGFWALVDWLTSDAMRRGLAPPTLSDSVLPGTVWTGFTEPASAVPIESVHIVPIAGRPSLGNTSNRRVLALSKSVGRLEPADGTQAFLCSTFLIAPQLVLCPIHFALKFAEQDPDGAWTIRNAMRVRFSLSDPTSDRVVERVVRTMRPAPGTFVDAGTLAPGLIDQCWPVVLELSEPAAAARIVLDTRAPEIAQRVAVIGFPRTDRRIPSESFAQHFAGAAGEKHFMPGAILRSPGTSWTFDYDCFTADGTSGGPVVDLETGSTIGMHVAAYVPNEGRKRGIAVALTRLLPSGL